MKIECLYLPDRDGGVPVAYNPRNHGAHIAKFAGWLNQDQTVLFIFVGEHFSHEKIVRDIRVCIREYYHGTLADMQGIVEHKPEVVGDIDSDGLIGWMSSHFNATTPKKYRSRIKEILDL